MKKILPGKMAVSFLIAALSVSNVGAVTMAIGDGFVQLAYANIAWEIMLDGEVYIDLIAPNEPYMTIDYAYLHTDAISSYENAVNDSKSGKIPEPAPLALMGLGLLSMAAYSKKRK